METNINQDTYINVISNTAMVAAARVEGVASVTNDGGFIRDKLSFKNLSKGVDIEITPSNQVIVNLSINAKYGYKILDLVCAVQEAVKREIEGTTLFKVKSVNISVVGVTVPL